MHRWLRHGLLELKLLIKNPLFAALPVIYAVFYLLVVNSGQVNEKETLYTLTYTFHMIGHTMTLGVAMLIGILLIRRDVRRPAFEWYRSLPLPYELQLSAKYAVGFLYLSLFTLSTAAIFYTFSISSGIRGDIAYSKTMDFAVQYEVSYLVTLALAMLLAVCIPNRVVYLIGFCAWMFGTLFMDIFLINGSELWFLQTFHLNQFFIDGRLMNFENWGYDLLRRDMRHSRIFVLAFALLLISVSLVILNRMRPTMNMTRSWITVVICAVLAVAAFVPYGSMWQERYAELREQMRDESMPYLEEAFKQQSSPSAVGFFSVSSYDMELSRHPDDTLDAKVLLTVPTEEWEGRRKLPLTLNRSFVIKEIRVQNKKASYLRNGDEITVDIPRSHPGELRLEVKYSGRILPNQVSLSSGMVFSQGTEVNLPSYMAWYPLPGHQRIYVAHSSNSMTLMAVYGTIYYPASEVHLTLQGYPVPVYTGLKEKVRQPGLQTFSGYAPNGISLLAGADWIELQTPGLPVTLVTTPYKYNSARSYLEELKRKYDYFSAWVPDFKTDIDTILLIDHNHIGNAVKNHMIFSYWYYPNDRNLLSGDWMNSMLFGNQPSYYHGWPEDDVRAKISSLFWYMYYREVEGLTDEQLKRRYFGRTLQVEQLLYSDEEHDPNQIGLEMTAMVSKAIEEGHSDKVKRLLVYFYEQGLMFPDLYIPSAPRESIIPYSEWQHQWMKMVGENK